jgi:glycerophosphoryl diester phosphodiesterase
VNLLRPRGGFWKVAHRGGAALGPENTLAAVRAALARGVDMVELDVVEAEGELRLAHSAAQAGGAPSLEEALGLFRADVPSHVALDLDLKSPDSAEEVLAALGRHRLLERTLLTSFYAHALRAAHALEPALPTGLSYPNDRYGLSERRPFAAFVGPGLGALRRALPLRIDWMLGRARANAAMLHHALVTAPLVERCHRRGAAVFVWTVESEEDLQRVVSARVDGVIVDDPGLFDG